MIEVQAVSLTTSISKAAQQDLGLETYIAFGLVISISVAIVWYAVSRVRTASDYLVAGSRIGPTQNALALAGDFVGVGGFFAITGLIALYGIDGFVFALGAISGFPLMLFLFAGPLQRLGKYTLADVMKTCVQSNNARSLVALTQLIVVLVQFTAQLVGAMALVNMLFGISPEVSLAILGAVIAVYVLLGGMVATTWLQIVKCCLMIFVALGILVASLMLFGFDPIAMVAGAVDANGPQMVTSGKLFHSKWDMLSIMLALAIGNASMPHILMRLNTVPNADAARRSVFRATGIIVVFHILILMLGFASAVVVGSEAILSVDPGGNMALPMLARSVGGDAFFGIVAAIALTTIFAVIAGLVMAGAAALSHDLWIPWRRTHGVEVSELKAARWATVFLILIALLLALVFRGQNLGFLSAMGYAVAASVNFPILILALFWSRFSVTGAIACIIVGLSASLILIWFSPLVQVGVLDNANAIFPLQNPTLFSLPAALIAGVLGSLVGKRSPKPT